MKKFLVLAGALGVILLALFLFETRQNIISPIDAGITYEVVSTPEAMAKGLGGRSDIPHDYGMLFVFATSNIYHFWMKDMLVPIDILWLSTDGTIIGIDVSVSPDTYPATFAPPRPARFVLEMRAGEAKLKNLSVGLRLLLPSQLQKQ
ncbi:MAG: DUF192 domain-containing protein [Candidatus Pacebacteria bacterium]|nr:DUF192 domain-containing protein [Candidatus Paceibacterota bacterium]